MTDVAILLATYNSGDYLKELIDSLLAQTYAAFTLYIRDDCSSDNTLDIIGSYSDSRIQLLPNSTPSGSAQNNFFALLGACSEPYILFCDADDVWLPEKIEKTRARMRELEQQHGKHCPILVHTDLTVVDAQLNTIAPSLFRYEKLSPRRTALHQLLAQNHVTGCTAMINAALHALVPQPPANAVMHDWWLALIAAVFGEIAVLEQPLILYRQHGDNQVGAYNASDLAAAARKLSKREHMRAVYNAMYAQAGCFADTFAPQLSARQLELCRTYAAMPTYRKLKKIQTIFKYKFFKNTLLRNMGQLWAV